MLASLGLPGLSGFVGEVLVFVGAFAVSPAAAAVATLVVVLSAAYMMWMYQRVVFGELSDFLKGIGHHLTDVTPQELLTLTPLVGLTILLGVAPGIVLDLVVAPINDVLAQVGGASVAVLP